MARTIDVHQHFLPDFFWRETNEGANPVGGIMPPPWTESTALAFMDDAGIDVAVLSLSTPGVHVGDDAHCSSFRASQTARRPRRELRPWLKNQTCLRRAGRGFRRAGHRARRAASGRPSVATAVSGSR